jgi:hypothetical protein
VSRTPRRPVSPSTVAAVPAAVSAVVCAVVTPLLVLAGPGTAATASHERPSGSLTTVTIRDLDGDGVAGRIRSGDPDCVTGRKVVLRRTTAGLRSVARADERGRFAFALADALDHEEVVVVAVGHLGCAAGSALGTLGVAP